MTASLSVMGTIHVLLIPVVLSLLILVLSAFLGWAVALIAMKVKHKNVITVCISLVFIAAYYYVYGMAYSFVQTLLLHLETVGDRLKIVLYQLYHMGRAAEGAIGSMLIFTAIIMILTAITYRVLSKSFLKLATADHGVAKSAYKEQNIKAASVSGALLRKELYCFTGSANYMLNCGLGILLMPVSAAVLFWKADVVRGFLLQDAVREYVPLLAAAVMCLLMTMNDMAAPSVFLEGKHLWIAQSMLVSGRQVLKAKLKLHLLFTWIPAIPLVIVMEWLVRPKLLYAVLIPVIGAAFAVMMAEIGLGMNLKMPNLHWTSEIVPIKQSAPVTVSLFAGWLIVVAFAGVYVFLKNVVSVSVFLVLSGAMPLAVCVMLHHWLMTKGAGIFETLG